MLADIGIAPTFLTLIVFIAFAILADFLLELYSLRMTLATGRLQRWLYDNYGRSNGCDSLISFCFQFLSFRKRSYFLHMTSFFNVGAFTKVQAVAILFGALIGVGGSIIILIFPNIYLALALVAVGFFANVFAVDQGRDFGVGMMAMGMMFLAIIFYSEALTAMAIKIHQIPLTDIFILAGVVFTSAFFRTPLPFLILFSLVIFLKKVDVNYLPLVFLLHSLTSLATYYGQYVQRFRRVNFALTVTLIWQLGQFLVSSLLVYFWGAELGEFLISTKFVDAFPKAMMVFAVYNVGILIFAPVLFGLEKFSIIKDSPLSDESSQKIMPPVRRGRVFSLHFSLFLLRQEFVKMTTLVHTIFKLGREADIEEDAINIRLKKYKGVLDRVGNELKELCFSVGKQRAYRWHIQEILDYYKTINQLELIVDDLATVFDFLQKKGLPEDLDRECRYWLNLQLLTYEAFFIQVTGVEDETFKPQESRRKSYEVLDRIFAHRQEKSEMNDLSKVFYRVTDNVGSIVI